MKKFAFLVLIFGSTLCASQNEVETKNLYEILQEYNLQERHLFQIDKPKAERAEVLIEMLKDDRSNIHQLFLISSLEYEFRLMKRDFESLIPWSLNSIEFFKNEIQTHQNADDIIRDLAHIEILEKNVSDFREIIRILDILIEENYKNGRMLL